MIAFRKVTHDIRVDVSHLPFSVQCYIIEMLDNGPIRMHWQSPLRDGEARYFLRTYPQNQLWLGLLQHLLEPFSISIYYSILKG